MPTVELSEEAYDDLDTVRELQWVKEKNGERSGDEAVVEELIQHYLWSHEVSVRDL